MRNRTWTWPVVMAAAGLAASSAGIDAQTDRLPGSDQDSAAPNASAAAEAPNSGAPVPPRAPQAPAEGDSKGPKLSTAEASMLRSRSARTLLRNGTDYIKYQQFEKALTYLREAERRQKELNAGEKSSLRQAIETAQQGMRTPSLQSGYARNRRPQAGSIAIAGRGAAQVSKTDPAVARTEAAQPAPAERMNPAATTRPGVQALDPLAPEILAKELPSAADLAESKSTRSALQAYEAAGGTASEPRRPMELPRPLNEKIDSLGESESQFQASESRPEASPEAIAANLAAMRRDGMPEPLPGSPTRQLPAEATRPEVPKTEPDSAPAPLIEERPVSPDVPKTELAPAPLGDEKPLAEPKPEPLTAPAADQAEPELPKFERPAAPVVATPELPPLEPAETPAPAEPAATKPEADTPEPRPVTEPAELPKLPQPGSGSAPAEMPPLPLTTEEPRHREDVPAREEAPVKVVAPAREEAPAEPELPAAKPEELKEPALPELPRPIANETLIAAEPAATDKPAAVDPKRERDTNLSKVQDLTAPAAPEENGKPDKSVEPAEMPKAAESDEPGLPPLPSPAPARARSAVDALPPLSVQPIAEAADDKSDLPPLPDRGVSPEPAAGNGLPPLPTAIAEPAEKPAAEKPVQADLPQLPATAAEPEAMPPLPTAAAEPAEKPVAEKPAQADLPQLPAAAAESEKMPPLPDSPPAPTPTAAAAEAETTLPKLPEPAARVAQATPGETRTPSSDSLPPLPAEEITGTARAEAPAAEASPSSTPFSRRFLSGLNERQRREIEELARMQQERTGGTTPGLSPLEAPAREAGENPRVPLPAGSTSMFGAIDDPLVRLELPRAPSPAEARPIRAILLPEQFDTIKAREFDPRRKMWASAATAHYPLYFQDPSLERYGISVEQRMGRAGRKLTYPIDDPKESKLRNQIATPFFSSGLFALQIATWPFRAIADPPWESTYDLGYYRPGDLVPEDTVVIPWKGVGPLFRGNGY